jgi:CBS domain-containing protein
MLGVTMVTKPEIRVGDVMTVGVITMPHTATAEAAAKLFQKTKVGCIIVTKDKKAHGIVTERDMLYKVMASGKNPRTAMLSNVMSAPLRVIRADKSIEDAALALKENRIKRLPVINKKGQMVGIITEGDLLRVYPGLTDILVETAKMRLPVNEELTGICDICGLHSDDLKHEAGKLICEDCREEDEI